MAEMSAKLRERYRKSAAEFLDPGEQVEWAVDGRPGTFGNYVLNSTRMAPLTRRLLLTDRHVYVFAVKGRKPMELLFKRERADAKASYKKFPPTLIVDEQQVTPTLQSAGRCASVVRALETTSAGPDSAAAAS